MSHLIAILIAAGIAAGGSPPAVVINEIFYNAPADHNDVQWIELYNTTDQPIDLAGFSLKKGLTYTFPEGTAIEAHGYQVLARDPAKFQKAYGAAALGPFDHPLSRHGGRIELLDAHGKRMDSILYKSRGPWPVSPDGYSASLERICPAASGEASENWAASPLPLEASRPAGTPGKPNSSFSAILPPVIAGADAAPDDPAPGEPLRVQAEVRGHAPREVNLLYRVVAKGVESDETAVPMEWDPSSGRFRAAIPGQPENTLVRYRIQARNEEGAARIFPAENDLRPTLSAYIHLPWPMAKVDFGLIIHVARRQGEGKAADSPRAVDVGGFFRALGSMGRRPPVTLPPRGASAFVHVDHQSGKTTVFDHVNIPTRPGDRGFKVHFHKDRTLEGMSVASIIFEGSERFLLAEDLAYDVYRRAGNAAPRADFLRLWVDGRMVGYHLLVEVPNRSFLRRNHIRDDGNLYKIIWYAQGAVGQHQQKSGSGTGHQDLLEVIRKLGEASGDAQWDVIEENFNVREVATYFAVNMVLDHWDGFFNNYYAYHDAHGTGKWEMYPWDQDKTWGYHDGIGEDQVFTDLPLTYGMEGDRPPGAGGAGGRGRGLGFFGGFNVWWRPGGYFSRPLLANPQFRKVFLQRTRELVEKIYTPEIYFPVLDTLADRLEEDVKLRAEAQGMKPEAGARRLAHNIQSLRTHLTERRKFLLDQKDLRDPAGDDSSPR